MHTCFMGLLSLLFNVHRHYQSISLHWFILLCFKQKNKSLLLSVPILYYCSSLYGCSMTHNLSNFRNIIHG